MNGCLKNVHRKCIPKQRKGPNTTLPIARGSIYVVQVSSPWTMRQEKKSIYRGPFTPTCNFLIRSIHLRHASTVWKQSQVHVTIVNAHACEYFRSHYHYAGSFVDINPTDETPRPESPRDRKRV